MEVQNTNIEQITKEILQLKKATIENMFEIGRKLIEVKSSLPHGKFGKYLEENVDISTRSANNYMKVVTEFSNSQTFANLEPSKLVILLDVPKKQIDNFSEENDLEKMSCREIKEKIKELKKTNKKEKNNKTKDKNSEQQESEKTYSENSTEDNQSNYDEDGSYNPFKNFKSKDYEDFFKDFNFEQFKQKPLMLDMSPEEKKTLKKFYNILAKQVHPDKGGNQEDMQVLNKLKEGWGI